MKTFEKASWIWRKGPHGIDEFCDFLTTFEASARGSYTLKISADSNYTVWLNGQLAAFGQYADYPTDKVYDSVDITPYVKEGGNRMVITVWYYGINTQTYRVGEAGLIFEVMQGDEVIAYSGTHVCSRLSLDYVSGQGDLISGQLGPTYHYDMKGDDGFRTSGGEGFDTSCVVENISTDFRPRPNQKLLLCDRMPIQFFGTGAFTYCTDAKPHVNMQYANLSYRYFGELRQSGDIRVSSPTKLALGEREMDKDADGIYFVIDLGEETAGFLDIDIEVPHACRLDVGYGEHLNDGRCRTSVRGFFCDIELKEGRNQYLHTFRRFGCRYVQFFVHAREVVVHYAGIRPTIYPFKVKKYASGNLLRDTIYQVCQNTLIHCHHEHYEDCPWREQALYTMDSRNQMLCGYYAFDEYEAPRASLQLMANGLRDDGILMLCYPAGIDAPIPAFSCMYFVQMEEYIRYSGDTSLAETNFDLLETIMSTFLSRMQPEGVIENFYGGNGQYWNFYEWSPTLSGRFGETERRLEAPLNAFVSLALQSLAKISVAIGKVDRAEHYNAIAKELNRAIAKKFYNPETKLFETFDEIHRGWYATLTQALCTLCGAADGLDMSKILPILATNGKDGGAIPNTLSMNAFRFDALLAIDKEKYAPVILDELDRDYLYMLRGGATTFWETIVGASDFADAGSLCHGWSALPVYYYELLHHRS